MFSCHKLTKILTLGFIQRFVSGYLLLSEDGKDVADVALQTEELPSILGKEESLNLGSWNPPGLLIIPCFSSHSLKERNENEISCAHLTPGT